jgi:hypothetical protein
MWETIITAAVKLVWWWLDKQTGNAEAKKKFLQFVDQVDLQYLKSASLRASYEEQIKELSQG